MKQVKITVTGRVQGVFYRVSTKKVADELGITGYAKNMPNGSVEVIAQGTEAALQQLIAFCKEGPSGSKVDNVDVQEGNKLEQFDGFEIK